MRTVGVLGQDVGHPGLAARLVDVIEAIGGGLVRAEETEVVGIGADHVAQQAAQRARVLFPDRARPGDFDGIVAKIGPYQGPAQQAAVGDRIGAHAARPLRRQLGQLRDQPTIGREQPFRLVAPEPGFQLTQMGGVAVRIDGDLVGTPETFDLVSIDFLRTGPALRCAQHDHRPFGQTLNSFGTCLALDRVDFIHYGIECGGERLVNRHRLIALDKIRLVAVAAHEAVELFVADA